MDCGLPDSSVHGILQARILKWVAIPTPGDLPDPGIEPKSLVSPALAGGFFTTVPPGNYILFCRHTEDLRPEGRQLGGSVLKGYGRRLTLFSRISGHRIRQFIIRFISRFQDF